MALKVDKVNSVDEKTWLAITRKSAQTLPNNPSAKGYPAEEIKRRLYQPIIDATNSALAEINRVVDEVNNIFGQVTDELDNFIETTKIKESYKATLDSESWVKNNETNMYEFYITKEQHQIEEYKEIGVDMFLLDGDGKYIQVNQYDIQLDGTIRCYHESNGPGYVSVYIKREGFIIGSIIVDANRIIGLSKVGKTNDYEDLDNKPDLTQMGLNSLSLSKIISGEQEVNKAINAKNATNATYAESAKTAENAENSKDSKRAEADQFGVNFHKGYAKQNGKYLQMSVGHSVKSDNAKNDEDGVSIKGNYARTDGNYPNMKAGATSESAHAKKADLAAKATADGNGAEISKTYAIRNGDYPDMKVGKAVESTRVSPNGTLGANVTAVTTNIGDKSENVATTRFVHNAVDDYALLRGPRFEKIIVKANLYTGKKGDETTNRVGNNLITFTGEGITFINQEDGSKYWLGTIHGRAPQSSQRTGVAAVKLGEIKFENYTISKIINGGELSHKESDDAANCRGGYLDFEFGGNRVDSCIYYNKNDINLVWNFDNTIRSYIVINNFMVKFEL